MARVPISGNNNTEALTDSGTDVRQILEDGSGNSPDFDGNGRVFELLSLEVTNSHATAPGLLEVYDSDETATVTAGDQRFTVHVPAGDTVQLSWARGSGKRFATNIVASISAGTVAVHDCSCSGELI